MANQPTRGLFSSAVSKGSDRHQLYTECQQYTNCVMGTQRIQKEWLVDCSKFFQSLGWSVVSDFRDWDNARSNFKELGEINEIVQFLLDESDAFKAANYHEIRDSYLCYKRDHSGKIAVCISLAPFVLSVPVVYLCAITVAAEYRRIGFGTQAIYSISEFIRSFIGKNKGSPYDIENAPGLYIVAGQSKVTKPGQFFESLGFVEDLPTYLSPWKTQELTMSYLYVQTANDFEAHVANSDLFKRSLNQIILDWDYKNQGKGVILFGEDKLKKARAAIQAIDEDLYRPESTKSNKTQKKRESKAEEKKEATEKKQEMNIISLVLDKDTNSISRTQKKNDITQNHCLAEGCKYRIISVTNWAKHVNKVHEELKQMKSALFSRCGPSCKYCDGFNEEEEEKDLTKETQSFQGPTTSNKRTISQKEAYNGLNKEIVQDKAGNNLQKRTKPEVQLIKPSITDHQQIQGQMEVQQKIQQQVDQAIQVDQTKVNQDVQVQFSVALQLQAQKLQKIVPKKAELQLWTDSLFYIVSRTAPKKESQEILFSRPSREADIALITKLRILSDSKQSTMVDSIMLIEQSDMFSQIVVYKYIQKECSGKLRECINWMLEKVATLKDEQAIGIITAAYAASYDCWVNAVRSLRQMSEERQKLITRHISYLVSVSTSDEIATWVYEYWMFINNNTHTLIQHLIEKRKDVIHRDILILSLLVEQDDYTIDEFVSFCHSVNTGMKIVLQKVLVAIEERPKQIKISLEKFQNLIDMLSNNSCAQALKEIENQLSELVVSQWIDTVKEYIKSAGIEDADSVQSFLSDLCNAYKKPSHFSKDITQSNLALRMILGTIKAKPNNKQLALSQYIVGNSYKNSRQLWVVPSGQGKSRIAPFVALIGLIGKVFTKIHMVFSNEHLMQRDKADFNRMWVLSTLENSVSYHTSFDFQPAQKELIIIDEADVFIFENPEKFAKFTANNPCVCFTATTAIYPLEQQVQQKMGLIQYKYEIQDKVRNEVRDQKQLVPDQILEAETLQAKVEHIKELLKIGPVLLYTTRDLVEILDELNPIIVDDQVDPKILRAADKKLENGYMLLVCETTFGMRGIDYRSEKATLQLLINKSFACLRDAVQGFSRVGRFGDPCKRIMFDGIQAIDQTLQDELENRLYQYVINLQSLQPFQQIQLSAPEVQLTATTLPRERVRKPIPNSTELPFLNK